jgi:SSS family solute:Na+ symporter
MNKPFNLNKMLHRGKYDLKGDHKKAADSIKVAWLKYVGINEEFTRTDRFMALALVSWNGLWIAIFFGAMGYQFLIEPIPDSLWGTFWQVWLYMQVGVGVPALIWFTIGSVFDMKKVFQRLATLQRDDTDDGRVVRHHLPGEADEPGDE